MKKNKKSLRRSLEKVAINQKLTFFIWLGVLAVAILIPWGLISWGMNAVFEKETVVLNSTEKVGSEKIINTEEINSKEPEKAEAEVTVLVIYRKTIPWLCLVTFLFFSVKTFLDGRREVDANCVFLLECFGKFIGDKEKSLEEDDGVLKEGLNFVFPYFGFLKTHNDVQYFLGRTPVVIFGDKTKPADLKDASVYLTASVNIQIVDPRIAAYSSSNYKKIITDMVQAAVADSIKNYTMTEAKEKRGEFKLFSIFATDKEKEDNKNTPQTEKIPEEVSRIEKIFGIRLLDIVLSDIAYTEEQIELMTVISKAENKKEEMNILNQIAIATAKNNQKVVGIDTKTQNDKLVKTTKVEAKRMEDLGEAKGKALKNYLKEANIEIDDHKELEAIGAIDRSSVVIGDSLTGILGRLVATSKTEKKQDEKEE